MSTEDQVCPNVLLARMERDYSVFEKRMAGATHAQAVAHLGLSVTRSMNMTDRVSRRIGLYDQRLAIEIIRKIVDERPQLSVWRRTPQSKPVLMCSVLRQSTESQFMLGTADNWIIDSMTLTPDAPCVLRRVHVARVAASYLQSILGGNNREVDASLCDSLRT